MALSVGEANAVNLLARSFLRERDLYQGVHPTPSDDDVKAALRLLLKGASKTLMAGFSPDDVDTHWIDDLAHRPAPSFVQHGVNCIKEPHKNHRTGYLHAENDDSPYDVDGWPYCGRCHTVLPRTPAPAKPKRKRGAR